MQGRGTPELLEAGVWGFGVKGLGLRASGVPFWDSHSEDYNLFGAILGPSVYGKYQIRVIQPFFMVLSLN